VLKFINLLPNCLSILLKRKINPPHTCLSFGSIASLSKSNKNTTKQLIQTIFLYLSLFIIPLLSNSKDQAPSSNLSTDYA